MAYCYHIFMCGKEFCVDTADAEGMLHGSTSCLQ